jgi:hypothetical protein
MRNVYLVTVLAACVIALSCKRDKPRPAPQDGRASASQPTPLPATAPSPLPTTRSADGTITEAQLLHFIAVSRKLVPALQSSGMFLQPSPEGFHNLSITARDDQPLKASITTAGMSPEQWFSVGGRAWSAWSVAQVDYNAEAPLRENAKQLAEAREKLAAADATLKSGLREMSPEQRAQRIAAARDAVINANDRSELWAQKAADLREQIAAAAGIAGNSAPGEPPAIAAVRADGLAGARAAQAAMSQELAVAERNERQARDDAKRAEESARHPEQPLNNTETSDLLRQSRETTDQAKLDIERYQQEEKRLDARLRDDRRVNADDRRKAGSEANIALLRKHLADFNDAWGLTVEGRPKKAE